MDDSDHHRRCNSPSDEYEPLVNEDETPSGTVRDIPPLFLHPYRNLH